VRVAYSLVALMVVPEEASS